MFFDARAAKALEPGQHIVVQGCPGLRLVANATRKTWIYRYRSPVDQKLRQVKIGLWPAVALAQAIARWEELRDQRSRGVDVKRERQRKRALATVVSADDYTIGRMVEDYASNYLNHNREPKGARAVTLRLRKALKSYEKILARDTTRALVSQCITKLIDHPVLAKSVKIEMAAAWRFALEQGYVPEEMPNWWGEKTSHKFRSKGALRDGERKGTGKHVLSDQEIRALLRDNLMLFSRQVQDFLMLQLWTCTRGAEICQMRRSQITSDKDGSWWTVPKQEMKGLHVERAYDLRVPLEGRALKIVNRLLADTPADVPWLFPSRSRKGVLQGQTQAYMQSKVHYMQPYSKSRPDHKRNRLTVTHWSPHDLRRTGRTMLAAMGCPHEVGEVILGHVLPGVAGDYNLYQYDKERRLWLKRLSQKLEEIAA
jgi:integrase